MANMYRSKPRTWLLILLPILVVGLFLVGEDLPLPHLLAIVGGVALYFVLFSLLSIWLAVYEARAAWHDAHDQPPGEPEPEFKATLYPGRAPESNPGVDLDREGFHWGPEISEDLIVISPDPRRGAGGQESHWRDN